jgi:uncharacterized protein YjiS (DUF1127 family)
LTVAQLFLRAVQRWQRRRAIIEIQLLDDRQLRDIGIARNDIPRVVDGLFHPMNRTVPVRSPLAPEAEPRSQLREAA